MTPNSQGKCPGHKTTSQLSIFDRVFQIVQNTVHRIIPPSKPYTFKFGKEYLGLKNMRPELQRIIKEFDIDTIYQNIIQNGAQSLLDLEPQKGFTLLRHCESQISIGITEALIAEGKNMQILVSEEVRESDLTGVLQYLFSSINDTMYDIAIAYIESLKLEGNNSSLSQNAKILQICLAFGKLQGFSGLSEDTKKLIFYSGITVNIVNLIEMIGFKIDQDGYDKNVLLNFISQNEKHWNDFAKSRIPSEYTLKGLGFTKTSERNIRAYSFDKGSIEILPNITERKFQKLVKKVEKQEGQILDHSYVGCPLLYERDETSGKKYDYYTTKYDDFKNTGRIGSVLCYKIKTPNFGSLAVKK